MATTSTMNFDFISAGRIIFGSGTLSRVADFDLLKKKRVFVFEGSPSVNSNRLHDLLKLRAIQFDTFSINGEPALDSITTAIKSAKQAEVIVAMGGGSVIDTGKAVSALLTNPGQVTDYLEVVGKGKPLINPALPFIAIPTTSGTGSEVTRNAVIDVPAQQVKVSLRHTYMLPTIALIDPELTLSLPKNVTATSGMDALTQVIEPYVSNKSNIFIDALCRDAISKAAFALERAFMDGLDLSAREYMSWVSLCGGLALANAGLGAVHGFAGPIGGMYHAPHGAICAKLLPSVVKANIDQCLLDNIDSVVNKYREIAYLVTNKENAKEIDLIDWLFYLIDELEIPPLSHWGIKKDDFPVLVQKAENSSSMKGNPIRLNTKTLTGILQESLY